MSLRVLLGLPRTVGAAWLELVSKISYRFYTDEGHTVLVRYVYVCRYHCNRFNEKESQNARDQQAVSVNV